MAVNMLADLYKKRHINRALDQKEKTLVWKLFLYDKKTPRMISKLLNVKFDTISKLLYNREIKAFEYPEEGSSFLGPKTAYWEKESELIESFNPKYSSSDLKGWEKDKFKSL